MLVFELPIPGKAEHPNSRSRSHWPKTKAKKKQREAVGLLARSQALRQRGSLPLWTRAEVVAVFHTKSGRKQDADNLTAWLKSTFDGLEDAQIIANDRGLTCKPPTVEKAKGTPFLWLKVAPEGCSD